MAVLFLLLFLCGPPQAAADNIQTIYVALGEAMELPCPAPPTLSGDELLSWFRSPAGSFTALVAQVQVARPGRGPSPEPGKSVRASRLKLLGNYSLWLEKSKEGDAGRYWCAVLGQHHKYQNWRVYDVSVLRGSQLSARAADGSPCSILLCSVAPARRLDSVTCLAASMDASPALCARATGWDVSWILMLLLAAGQGFTILALSIMLWRQRVQRAQCRDASIPHFKPEIQVYENIHVARLRSDDLDDICWEV
ncbi:lymphocyte antigen 6 complex locus protein G6f isoform X1 [Prionailurus iriomotensis]